MKEGFRLALAPRPVSGALLLNAAWRHEEAGDLGSSYYFAIKSQLASLLAWALFSSSVK